jgi:hypothetical protein
MHKSAMKCNKTLGKWCKNKHGASKIIDTFWTYQSLTDLSKEQTQGDQAMTEHLNKMSALAKGEHLSLPLLCLCCLF